MTKLRDVERYAACTFFASSSSETDVNGSKSAITETISFLVDNEFIRVQSVKEKKSSGEEVRCLLVFLTRYKYLVCLSQGLDQPRGCIRVPSVS